MATRTKVDVHFTLLSGSHFARRGRLVTCSRSCLGLGGRSLCLVSHLGLSWSVFGRSGGRILSRRRGYPRFLWTVMYGALKFDMRHKKS